MRDQFSSAISWVEQKRKTTLVIVLLFFIVGFPRWTSVIRYWSTAYIALTPYLNNLLDFFLSEQGRTLLVVVGIVWLILDSRIKKTKRKFYNLRTLRGRVLQLHDDIEGFLRDAKSRPNPPRPQGMSSDAYSSMLINEVCLWEAKVSHGYELRFGERVRKLYHECGEAGTPNDGLGLRINNSFKKEGDIREILDDIAWLSRHV